MSLDVHMLMFFFIFKIHASLIRKRLKTLSVTLDHTLMKTLDRSVRTLGLRIVPFQDFHPGLIGEP